MWAELATAHGLIVVVIVANVEEVRAGGSTLGRCSNFLSLSSSAWKTQAGGGDSSRAQTTFLPQIRSVEVNSQAAEVTPESSQLRAKQLAPSHCSTLGTVSHAHRVSSTLAGCRFNLTHEGKRVGSSACAPPPPQPWEVPLWSSLNPLFVKAPRTSAQGSRGLGPSCPLPDPDPRCREPSLARVFGMADFEETE